MRDVVELKNTDRANMVTCALDGPFARDGIPYTMTILAGETVTVDASVLRCQDVSRRLKPNGPLKEIRRYRPVPGDPAPMITL